MADCRGIINRSLAIALTLAIHATAFHATSVHAQLGTPVGGIATPVSVGGTEFTQTQLQYDRVLEARLQMRYGIKKLFRERGLRYPAADIYLRVFKREHVLELWVRPEGDTIFSMLRTYPICAMSGELGPKRARGDNQVPEGFYTLDAFNPYSDYHLSLHVNYPNRSDQLTSTEPDLGGDIFIHGGCNSIGCLALTDEGVKQLYWIAVEARSAGQQRIPIDIFPARLGDDDMTQLEHAFRTTPELVSFWKTLKPGFDYFETTHTLPNVRVDAGGRYVINNQPLPKTALDADPKPKDAPLGTPVVPPTPPTAVGSGGR
jgi:murein L,D-transpeptidase YafK